MKTMLSTIYFEQIEIQYYSMIDDKCLYWVDLLDKIAAILHHDDVTKFKHIPRHWPFVGGIHRWNPVSKPIGVGIDFS